MWQHLPNEILARIALRIEDLDDFVALSLACKEVRSLPLLCQWLMQRTPFPLLTALHVLPRIASSACVAAAVQRIARDVVARIGANDAPRLAEDLVQLLAKWERSTGTEVELLRLAGIRLSRNGNIASCATMLKTALKGVSRERGFHAAFDVVGALFVACCTDAPVLGAVDALLEVLPRELLTGGIADCLLVRAAGLGLRPEADPQPRVSDREDAERADVLDALVNAPGLPFSPQGVSDAYDAAIARDAWSALRMLLLATILASWTDETSIATAPLVRFDTSNWSGEVGVLDAATLHYAAAFGACEMIEALLEAGVSTNIACSGGILPLQRCCHGSEAARLLAAACH